ncbi:hypothetical protein OEZ86_010038 [Tetradesmus obliquus]|uniref:BTB domain-containing protein n=1 Tax=Tetradesmus obliquus TaxID=3088 RepID=A0ABY8UP71_TETOB|nr:hypothetical protein OEZ85_001473 [Tetradesmus obliquus]WIA43591.1 hypothetical protein OEZ86_010038 [Tetradesmus obliquus]
MAQASKETTGSAAAASTNEQLLELLSLGTDVQLLFEDEAVPGHAQTLSMWSKVLSNALEAGNCSSSSSASLLNYNSKPASGPITIPMDGTSKNDWLTAVSFIYPVVPQALVTWDNLEMSTASCVGCYGSCQVLLAIGSKYDMPALLSRAATFLESNKNVLNSKPGSLQFVWKWIPLADAAGLSEVAQACIDSAVKDIAVVAECKKEVLLDLSPATSSHLAAALAEQIIRNEHMRVKAYLLKESAPAGCNWDSAYCSHCMTLRRHYKYESATVKCGVCRSTVS